MFISTEKCSDAFIGKRESFKHHREISDEFLSPGRFKRFSLWYLPEEKMIINKEKIQDVEVVKIGEKLKPGFAGPRKLAIYEARVKQGQKTLKKKSEDLNELLAWIQKKKAA